MNIPMHKVTNMIKSLFASISVTRVGLNWRKAKVQTNDMKFQALILHENQEKCRKAFFRLLQLCFVLQELTLCMLSNCSCYCCRLLTFSK